MRDGTLLPGSTGDRLGADGGDASRALAALERGTRGGDALPRGAPRLHCRMAVGRLRDAAGRGDGLELELDLLEAERCLWAARADLLELGLG